MGLGSGGEGDGQKRMGSAAQREQQKKEAYAVGRFQTRKTGGE